MFVYFFYFVDFVKKMLLLFFFKSEFVLGCFDTSGSIIPLSVPEIEGGTLSVTEKEQKKDWSWSILGVRIR